MSRATRDAAIQEAMRYQAQIRFERRSSKPKHLGPISGQNKGIESAALVIDLNQNPRHRANDDLSPVEQ